MYMIIDALTCTVHLVLSLQQSTKVLHVGDSFAHGDWRLGNADEDTNWEGAHN